MSAVSAGDFDDVFEVDVLRRAGAQQRNGWPALPLPTGKKFPPPKGFTGEFPSTSFADYYTIWESNPTGLDNLGARIPEGVVGVDVDAYNGKSGASTWEQLGGPEWPDTVVLSSRFGPGYDGTSGIRFYRLPDGIDQGMLWGAHDGIEILRHGHRYAVSPGSLHPEGGFYRAFDVQARAFLDVLPPVDALPMLTLEQARLLTVTGAPWASEVTERVVDRSGEMCAFTSKIVSRAVSNLQTSGSRYDTMSAAVWAIVQGEEEGHHSGSALDILKLAYVAAVGKDRREGGGEPPASEFDRNVAGALQKAAQNPVDEMFKACCSTGERLNVGEILDDLDDDTDDDADIESWSTADTTVDTAPADDDSKVRAFVEKLKASPGYTRETAERFAQLVINDEAKQLMDEYRTGEAFPLDGLSLEAFLSQPADEVQYRVGDLWPKDGRVMLVAAAKTGKTTMVVSNLIPALVNGTPFLGRFDTMPVTGNIVYLNLEVSEGVLRNWMQVAGVERMDRVIVSNLRGRASALTLSSTTGRQRVAEFLRSQNAEVVILDPLAPVLASLGLDENSNGDVAKFYAWWSETLALAGVVDDVIVHHAGHDGSRSRGASRLLDEPDAVWTLTKDQGGDDEDDLGAMFAVAPTRFLQAMGRDVELPAEQLDFDPETKLLTLTGVPKARARREARSENAFAVAVGKVRDAMRSGTPLTKSAIASLIDGNNQTRRNLVQTMIEGGWLVDTGLQQRGGALYSWREPDDQGV